MAGLVRLGRGIGNRVVWRRHALLETFTNPKTCCAEQGGRIVAG
jgi:hypothetical protein